MAEYIITPEKSDLPTAPDLMEELHRRGLPVEITVKGTAEQWESVKFVELGPPEIKCTLAHNGAKGTFSVQMPTNSPHQALELQLSLVDVLLRLLGGQADNTETRERYNPQQFTAKLREFQGLSGGPHELLWIFFSWVVVLVAVIMYFAMPKFHVLILILALLSLASAVGQTLPKLKNG